VKLRFAHARKIGFVSQKSVGGWFLALLLWRLPNAYTASATVLVDELDAPFLNVPSLAAIRPFAGCFFGNAGRAGSTPIRKSFSLQQFRMTSPYVSMQGNGSGIAGKKEVQAGFGRDYRGVRFLLPIQRNRTHLNQSSQWSKT